MNKICISGRLVKDPFFKKYDNNVLRCTMFLANNVFFGQNHSTGFYRVISWGKRAELVKRILKKGSEVYITGRLDQFRYEDENGKINYDVSIVLEEFNSIKQKISGVESKMGNKSVSENRPPKDGLDPMPELQDFNESFPEF